MEKKVTYRHKEFGTFHVRLTTYDGEEAHIDISNTWKEDRKGRSVTIPLAMLLKAIDKLRKDLAQNGVNDDEVGREVQGEVRY